MLHTLDKKSSIYHTFENLASYVKASYDYPEAFKDLNQFDYDKLASQQDISHNTREALEHMKQGHSEELIINTQIIVYICQTQVYVLEVICELA
jgi:hypothetical protein